MTNTTPDTATSSPSPDQLLEEWGGKPPYTCLPSTPKKTAAGTPYLTEAGVALMGRTVFNVANAASFLDGFDSSLNFGPYTEDEPIRHALVEDDPSRTIYYQDYATEAVKFAGQLCYMSFGPGRTMNAEAGKYVDNIKQQGHGSVLAHAKFTFLIWGVSRSFTHELVRHGVGTAYSQVSQRYVDGKILRFVERPEYQADEALHASFEARIDRAASDYDQTAQALTSKDPPRQSESRVEARKRVNQCARSGLPNETEAPILFSANVRALRHVIEMRASRFAEPEIRRAAMKMFLIIRAAEPLLFSDYTIQVLPDGTHAVATDWRKV